MITWLRNLWRRDPIRIEVTVNVSPIHVFTSGSEAQAKAAQSTCGPAPATESRSDSTGPSAPPASEDIALANFTSRLGQINKPKAEFGKET